MHETLLTPVLFLSQIEGMQFLLFSNLVTTTRLLSQEYMEDPPPADAVHIFDGMFVSDIGHSFLHFQFTEYRKGKLYKT